MRQTGVRLPEDIIKEIKILAFDKRISFQEAIKQAAEEWIQREKLKEEIKA